MFKSFRLQGLHFFSLFLEHWGSTRRVFFCARRPRLCFSFRPLLQVLLRRFHFVRRSSLGAQKTKDPKQKVTTQKELVRRDSRVFYRLPALPVISQFHRSILSPVTYFFYFFSLSLLLFFHSRPLCVTHHPSFLIRPAMLGVTVGVLLDPLVQYPAVEWGR